MYHQQLALQQANSTSKVNPCKSFIKELITWMVKGHQKGEWYILAGDFNEPLQSTSSTIKLCSNSTLQLVDILSRMADENFNTTKTGKDRINYILMSSDLAQSVQKRATNPSTRWCLLIIEECM
eukprot:6467088-Ditylum_brightwellii.AAC.1